VTATSHPREGVSEVAEGIHAVDAPFWGYPLTLYFVRDREWAVVDTGIAETVANVIVPFMAERGGIEALELALCTHGHVDHVGGNGALKAANPRIHFAVHEYDVGWTENINRHFLQLYKAAAPGAWDPGDDVEAAIRGGFGSVTAAADIVLVDGQTIRVGGRELEVRLAAAHSPGHVVFVDRAADLAFTGDVLQGAGFPNAASGLRSFPMYAPAIAYHQSLDLVRDLGVSTLCTAHEGVLSGDQAAAAIEASRRWADELHELINEILHSRRQVRLREVVAAVAERHPDYEYAVQIHVTCQTHLDELIQTGDAVPGMEPDGIKTWSASE
jgi:glyoxylase-like metal-dependent hydrolase (beta-lactamase superfamily II)